MMGAGKSYWAGKLGHYYSLPAYDLDKLVEQQAGKSIRAIFETEGEETFRMMEADLLRNSLVAKKFIMATGGGAPCFYNNMEYMKQNGIVVWINPAMEELIARVSRSIDTRPVLKGISSPLALQNHLQTLLDKRLAWYSQSQVVIEDDSSIERVVEKITAFEKLKYS